MNAEDLQSQIRKIYPTEQSRPPLKRDGYISYVPTVSCHGRNAVKILNDILMRLPEAAGTVYALLLYSTQKWASSVRKTAGCGISGQIDGKDPLTEALRLLNVYESRNDICTRNRNSQNRCLEMSDEILELMDRALEWIESAPDTKGKYAQVLKALHYTTDPDDGDISLYIFNQYYRDAVIYLNFGCGKKLYRLLEEMHSYRYMMKPSDGSVIINDSFHDTEQLLLVYRKVMHQYGLKEERSWLSSADIQNASTGLSLLSRFETAVNMVRSYHCDGELLFEILQLMIKGRNEKDICRILNTTPGTLKRDRDRAVSLLSFLLWGYSPCEILSGLSLFVSQKRPGLPQMII